ncbi:neuromedin-U receptor 2-like [Mytilus trossulus]|uniref:neuromedin-U receptor 2-like n=1 Tax=Mytilus trossulus TaxID=6551 RepID=UPI003005F997
MTNTTRSQLLDILLEIGEDETDKRVPVAVLIAVLSLVGIIGNIHILIIFSRNSKQQSTYHVFVFALAVSDLVVCSTYLPVEIVMVMNPFSFDYDLICRLSLVNCYTWGFWTVLLILSIAIERYRHICFPLKYQISCYDARKLCILLFVLAAIYAAPMGYISGTNSFSLSNATKGFECFINDSLENSLFPASYFVFVLAEGVLVGLTIIFLYIPVRRTIIKSNNIRKQMMNINIYKKSSNEEITCINTGIKSMLELSENFCENKMHTTKLTEDSAPNSVSTRYT